MAVSAIDISNLALDRLGQPTITTFFDGTKASNLCGRMYPLSRDFVLREFPWRRLKAWADIAALGTAPEGLYQRAFELPANMLRLLDVAQAGQIKNKGWELEGNTIVTNLPSPLTVRYLRSDTNPADWDELMINTIAAHMAMDMAETLTQSQEKKQFAVGQWAVAYDRARHANAQEGNPTPLNQPDDWELVRWASGIDVPFANTSDVFTGPPEPPPPDP